MNFKIKYLPDIFENVNFIANRNFCDNLLKRVEPSSEVTNTEDLWSCTNDISIRQRIKQAIVKERWAITIHSYENTDMTLLQSSESVELTLDNGEVWQVSEFDAKILNPLEQLHSIELSFTRDNYGTISLPFVSDNIEQKIGQPNFNYNKISVTKVNPEYVQKSEFYFDTDRYWFKFKRNTLTDNINIGEFYGVHPQNTSQYDILLWVCEVASKDSDYIYFKSYYNEEQVIDKGSFEDTIIIDNLSDKSFFTIPEGTDKILNYDIYTLFNPKDDTEQINGEEIKQPDGIITYDQITFRNYKRLLFFLRLPELWKYQYLVVADRVELYFNDELIDYSTNNGNISIIKDVDYFDQKECEFRLLVSSVTMKNT